MGQVIFTRGSTWVRPVYGKTNISSKYKHVFQKTLTENNLGPSGSPNPRAAVRTSQVGLIAQLLAPRNLQNVYIKHTSFVRILISDKNYFMLTID